MLGPATHFLGIRSKKIVASHASLCCRLQRLEDEELAVDAVAQSFHETAQAVHWPGLRNTGARLLGPNFHVGLACAL